MSSALEQLQSGFAHLHINPAKQLSHQNQQLDSLNQEWLHQASLIEKSKSVHQWLSLTRSILSCMPFVKFNNERRKFLSEIYTRALTSLTEPSDISALSELLVDRALFISQYSLEDAKNAFIDARAHAGSHAKVFIGIAQFKVLIGDVRKAENYLKSGLKLAAQPRDMLIAALHSLKNGDRILKPSVGHPSLLISPHPLADETSDSVKIPNKESQPSLLEVSHNDLNRKPSEDKSFSTDRESNTAPISLVTEEKENVDQTNSAGQRSLRSHYSTPDCKSASLISSTSKSHLSDRKRWEPRRVRRQVFDEVEEEERSVLTSNSLRLPSADTAKSETGVNVMPSLSSSSGTSSDLAPHHQASSYPDVPSLEVFLPPFASTAKMDVQVSSYPAPQNNIKNISPLQTFSNNQGMLLPSASQTEIEHKPSVQSFGDTAHKHPHVLNSFSELKNESLITKANSAVSNSNSVFSKPQPQSTISKPSESENKLKLSEPTKRTNSSSSNTEKNVTFTINSKIYQVLKKIGRGMTSVVYMVFDSEKCDVRAVKCVNLEDADETAMQSYKNEIYLLKRLQRCPSVIKMHDYEFQENKLYVVMEHGQVNLEEWFLKNKNLSRNTLLYYWEQMLTAIEALHKEGVVHSDLKPANFIIASGMVKLIDFGIAKAIQNEQTSIFRDVFVGTPNYMSPEAIKDIGDGSANKPNIKLGPRSDVWSLGCILYQLYHGHTPFHHIKSQPSKIWAISDPSVQINFSEVKWPELLDVLKSCLQRNPRERPSVSDLLKHPFLNSTVSNKDSGE